MARSRFALKRRFDVDLTSVWRRFDVSLTSTCLSGPYLSPCQVIVQIGALFTFHSKSRVVSAKYRDPPFFIVAVWNFLDPWTFSPGSSPRKNFEKISKTDENLAVLAFRAVKRRVKKWTFVATGEGVILDVRASAAWKNMNARERTTKIAPKLSDWQHFPFLDEKVNLWKSELLLRPERELSEMSEPVQLGKTWMHAKERRKLLENWAIGSLFRFWAKWNSMWNCVKL